MDLDVGGKNYGWSLKWTGHAEQGTGLGGRHAASVGKQSIEITRRFRTANPNFGGIMPFVSPFCKDLAAWSFPLALPYMYIVLSCCCWHMFAYVSVFTYIVLLYVLVLLHAFISHDVSIMVYYILFIVVCCHCCYSCCCCCSYIGLLQ